MHKSSLLLLVLGITACGDEVGVAGLWTGVSAAGVGVSFTLTETPQGVVTGAGFIINGVTSLPVNVTGAHGHPSLALTIDVPRINFAPISFQGVFDGTFTSVKGALNGSGLVRDTLKLNRMTAPSTQITDP